MVRLYHRNLRASNINIKRALAGSGEVALKYRRHFEGEGSVVKRFRFRLNAKP